MTEGWREDGKTYMKKVCPACACEKQLMMYQQVDPWSYRVRYEILRLCCDGCNHHWDEETRLPPGYGTCPLCRAVNPYNTTRERRLDGDTRCGACDGRTKSREWR